MKVHLATIVLALALIPVLALYLRFRQKRRERKHDPVEYYRRFAGYQLPLRLIEKIAKEEVEALTSAGQSYLVGHYGPNGRLLKAVKMLRGEMDFQHAYIYSPKGRLMSVVIARADGTVNVLGGGAAKDGSGLQWPAPGQSVPEHCVRPRERVHHPPEASNRSMDE
jgi:hypothetical protein